MSPPGITAQAESLGQSLLQALNGWRIQQLSLHDAQGEALWLSEGSLGPDEYADVLDAISAFALERECQHLLRRQDQQRSLYIAARDPAGVCTGLAFARLDGFGTAETPDALPPLVIAILRRFSMLLSPQSARAGSIAPASADKPRASKAPAPHPAPAPPVTQAPAAKPAISRPVAATAAPAPAPSPTPAAAPRPVTVSVQISGKRPGSVAPVPEPAPAYPPTVRIQAPTVAAPPPPAPDPAPAKVAAQVSAAEVSEVWFDPAAPTDISTMPLQARRYQRLRSGGATRRYEVLTGGGTLEHDLKLLDRVIQWLHVREPRSDGRPEQFFVPVSAGSATSTQLRTHLQAMLRKFPLDPALLGLSIPLDAWHDHASEVEALLDSCQEFGVVAALEGFWLGETALGLLQRKSVRLLRLDQSQVKLAMNERYQRAMLAAITQAARVLGLHCIAPGDVTASTAKWLASAGIDYVDRVNSDQASGSTTSVEVMKLAKAS